MRTVQPIPVAKVNEAVTPNKISGGESIVKESGGNNIMTMEPIDDSFVDIDNDVISNEEMERWMSRL